MTDGTGTTTYAYDDAGDMTSQALAAASEIGSSNQTMGHTYDAAGTVGSIIYPSYGSTIHPTVNYSYNSLGEMTSVTDWSGIEVGFAYDADGNRQTSTTML